MKPNVLVGLVAIACSCGGMPSRPDAGAGDAGRSSFGGGVFGSGGGGGAAAGGRAGGTTGGSGVGGGVSAAGGVAGGTSSAGGMAGGTNAAGGAAGGVTAGGEGGGSGGGESTVSDGGAGSAESCASAGDLRAASTMQPATGFMGRIVDTMGQVNDYSPLNTDAEPPNCSVVYPAPGLDRVFRITLQAAQRLELRLALIPGTAQPGLYVLNDCTTPTIRDGDGSGACGSNEYNVGFCGVVPPCANSTLSYTNTLGTAADVFVVVDQVANSNATSFTLDWRTVP